MPTISTNRKHSFLLAFALAFSGLFFHSCEKNNMPTLASGTPVFGLTGELDGEVLQLNAGLEEWFMFTRLTHDSTMATILEGILAQDTTESLKNAWSLKYRAPQNSSVFNADSALAVGLHSLFSIAGEKPIKNLFKVKFKMTDSINISNPVWNFGNGTFATTISPSITYNTDLQTQYPVRLTTVNPSNLCLTNVTHYIDFSQSDCQGSFEIHQGSTFSFYSTCVARTGNLNTVNWLVDGMPSGSGISGNFVNLSPGSHEICSEQIYADGCTYVSCRNLVVDSLGYATGTLCNNDFTYDIAPEMTFDPNQLGTFQLSYFDYSGKEFSTFFNPTTSTLNILASSTYEKDAFGRNTRQLEFEYSGPLQSADGQIKMATNLRGNMAIVLE